MNIEAFQQLKRVLADVPARQFDDCACGHATQDQCFVARGFSSCNDFGRAASFFQISRREASDLFSEHAREAVTPAQMIERIEDFLAQPPRLEDPTVYERRQAIIDGLLVKANKAAQAASRLAMALVFAFF